MSQLHQTPTERLCDLIHEMADIIRDMGLPWDTARNLVNDVVNSAQDREEHPEDYDYGQEDEETGVFQLPAPFCCLDDERGAA